MRKDEISRTPQEERHAVEDCSANRANILSVEDKVILKRMAENARRAVPALKDAHEMAEMIISPDLFFDNRDAERNLNIDLKTAVAISAMKCGLQQRTDASRFLTDAMEQYENLYEERIRVQERRDKENRSRAFSSVRTAFRLYEEDVTLAELSKSTDTYRADNKMLNGAAYKAIGLCEKDQFIAAAAVLNSALLESERKLTNSPQPSVQISQLDLI